MNLGANAGDRDPLRTEVDPHLVPGRGLEPHRREFGGTLLLPVRRQHALQRAQRNVDVLLGEQPLHDDAVACRRSVEQRASDLLLLGVECPRTGPCLCFCSCALA